MLAQVDHQYIVCIGASGVLFLVDQHAAHERVLLEHLAVKLRERTTVAITEGPRQRMHCGAGSSQQNDDVGGVDNAFMNCDKSHQPCIGGPSIGLLVAVQKYRQGMRREGVARVVLSNRPGMGGFEQEPVPLELRRLDAGLVGGARCMELSSTEWCVWLTHCALVKQWGWELVLPMQRSGLDAATDDPHQLHHSSATCVTQQQQGKGLGSTAPRPPALLPHFEEGGMGVQAILVQVRRQSWLQDKNGVYR